MNSVLKESNEGELKNIIKQISSASEFQDIIENISTSLQNLENENDESTENDSIDLTLGMFFLDKDGNNICDCINRLTSSIEKLIKEKNQKSN